MRRVTVAAGLSLFLLLGACSPSGSSSDTGSAPSTTTKAARATISSPTPTKLATPSPGCGHPADAPVVTDKLPGDVERTITVRGTKRAYRLGVPDAYDPDRRTPLVMNLHGSGSNAIQASIYSGVALEGSERGMLTVAPDAIDGKWQLEASGADHAFLLTLVKSIESRYCVDTDRVYVIGMSLGAWKAAAIACAAPETFAAAALVAVEVHPTKCPPMPVVAFHGTADPVVPYGEGSGHSYPSSPNSGLPGTHENIASWAKGNGCDSKPATKRIGGDVERWTYRDRTADVVLYTVFGGGHTWPGAKIKIGPTTKTIDATEIAFNWFESHPRTH